MVDRHKLSLGDTVERWLPGLVPGGDAITVRELLNHTSGIQSYDKVKPEIALIHLARRWTQRELVEIGISVPPLFPPGEGWSYTNTGYVLLGMIVQRATGESLRSELERRIFQPLGLTHTALPVTPHMAGHHSHGYFVDVPGQFRDVTRTSPTLGWGSGGIVSSPRDVNAFFRALMRGRLLPPWLMKKMRAPTPGSFTGDMESGLGLEHDTWSHACGAWGKAGAYPGFRTEAFVGPQGRRAATMYVNTWQSTATAGIAEDARLKAARLVACRMRFGR